MPLAPPNLDDRDFEHLLQDAKSRIAQKCPQWTDRSESDPGMVLLELFAYLTDTMIYRLNRLPTKAYVEFLRLMGVRVQPPAAASVNLVFSLGRPQGQPVEIPRGTRVAIGRATAGEEPPIFTTARGLTLEPGQTEGEVTGYHCDLVDAELVGVGTGQPGLSVVARRPPLVAPTGDELDLLVCVEAMPGELEDGARALEYGGKPYRIWREVENFMDTGADTYVYLADRMSGVITFAPAVAMSADGGPSEEAPRALAAVPNKGREIRLWYRRGGGPQGNVAAASLTTLKTPIAGVSVINPLPAAGGRAAETLDNALLRGPQELHSLERAVTARDFELVARKSSGAVARAKAFTKAKLWRHAPPGTVEVLLVPDLPEELLGTGQVTAARLKEQETESSRLRAQTALDERRPLATTCLVGWVRYKTARVRARVVVHHGEDPAAVKARVLERLHLTINPLKTRLHPSGWPFGEPLRLARVYEILLAEPGVSYADGVRLLVDEVPDSQVLALAADAFQPRSWYAASGDTLFRSLDDAGGWEPAKKFVGESVSSVRVHPTVAGLIAVATLLPEDKGSSISVSSDCGETWRSLSQIAFTVEDVAWMDREGLPVLLLATDLGLYELTLQPEAVPVQILVDPQQKVGFYAVVVSTGALGGVSVAVASRNAKGVFLSNQAGRPNTFRSIGLQGEDIRVLAVQYEGPNAFLWAGAAATEPPGKGCFRWQVWESGDAPEGWKAYSKEWDGGSCLAIAFDGPRVLAATHDRAVLWLDSAAGDPQWHSPDVSCGLPMREVGRFQPVFAIAVDPANRLLLAGGPKGTYRSRDRGPHYENCSTKEFLDRVTLPDTWLFCSGSHDIVVATARDGDLG